jgi:predicted amidohydrolase
VLDRVTVGIAQWLPLPGRPDENLKSAVEFIDELARADCDLVVLPELWPCGFQWGSLAEDARGAAESLHGSRMDLLTRAAQSAGAWLAAGSVPELDSDVVYNTAVLFDRQGKLRAWHRKAHLYAPSGEDRALTPGDRVTTCETDEFGVVGLSICFDGDFPEVARVMRARGARMVIHPSAYELAAESWWDRLYPANAMTNGQWWIMANQCGTNGSKTLLGGSQIISPFGDVVASASRVREGENQEPELIVATLDLRKEIERADAELGALWDLRRPELY